MVFAFLLVSLSPEAVGWIAVFLEGRIGALREAWVFGAANHHAIQILRVTDRVTLVDFCQALTDFQRVHADGGVESRQLKISCMPLPIFQDDVSLDALDARRRSPATALE